MAGKLRSKSCYANGAFHIDENDFFPIFFNKELKQTTKVVYMAAYFMHLSNCKLTVEKICENTCICDKTVREALGTLKGMGLIKIEQRTVGGKSPHSVTEWIFNEQNMYSEVPRNVANEMQRELLPWQRTDANDVENPVENVQTDEKPAEPVFDSKQSDFPQNPSSGPGGKIFPQNRDFSPEVKFWLDVKKDVENSQTPSSAPGGKNFPALARAYVRVKEKENVLGYIRVIPEVFQGALGLELVTWFVNELRKDYCLDGVLSPSQFIDKNGKFDLQYAKQVTGCYSLQRLTEQQFEQLFQTVQVHCATSNSFEQDQRQICRFLLDFMAAQIEDVELMDYTQATLVNTAELGGKKPTASFWLRAHMGSVVTKMQHMRDTREFEEMQREAEEGALLAKAEREAARKAVEDLDRAYAEDFRSCSVASPSCQADPYASGYGNVFDEWAKEAIGF